MLRLHSLVALRSHGNSGLLSLDPSQSQMAPGALRRICQPCETGTAIRVFRCCCWDHLLDLHARVSRAKQNRRFYVARLGFQLWRLAAQAYFAQEGTTDVTTTNPSHQRLSSCQAVSRDVSRRVAERFSFVRETIDLRKSPYCNFDG